MTANPDKAGYLLKEGIVLVRAAYLAQGVDKSIRSIEDELGCMIGKEGHTIRKWKAGEIPVATAFHDDFLQVAELLVRGILSLGRPYPDRQWGERFLRSIGHPAPEAIFATTQAQDIRGEINGRNLGQPRKTVQIQIVMNFNLPLDTNYAEVDDLLCHLKEMVGETISVSAPKA